MYKFAKLLQQLSQFTIRLFTLHCNILRNNSFMYFHLLIFCLYQINGSLDFHLKKKKLIHTFIPLSVILVSVSINICGINIMPRIYRVCLDWAYFCWNWKHYSEIIFKYVNSVVGPIFNKKVAKKCNLWDREQYTYALFTVDKVNYCGLKKKNEKNVEKKYRCGFHCKPNGHTILKNIS